MSVSVRVSVVPSVLAGTLAMLALAGVPLASADAVLVALGVAMVVEGAWARGPLGGWLGGAGVALLSLVGSCHGHVGLATVAAVGVALAALAVPRRGFRALLLCAAAALSGRFPPMTWMAAAVLYGVACSRGRLGVREGAGLALAVALLVPSCARSPAAVVFLAILAASSALVFRWRRHAPLLLAASFPLFDAVALAVSGHTLLALECVAVVPFARRLALVEAFA